MDEIVQNAVSDFWSKSASQFDSRASHIIHSGEWQNVLKEAFQSDTPKDVIDLGTGTGACAIIAAKLGHRVTAYDGSEHMLIAAGKAAEQAGVRVNFIHGIVEDTEIQPLSADIVTIRNVLWTVEDPDVVLRKAYKILRPEGKIIVADGEWSATENSPNTYKPEIEALLPYHRGISERDARKLIANAGFTAIESHQHLFQISPYPSRIQHFVLSALKQ